MTTPSGESIDLLVRFTPGGDVEDVRLYDTAAEVWGEPQTSVRRAVRELRRRIRRRQQ